MNSETCSKRNKKRKFKVEAKSGKTLNFLFLFLLEHVVSQRVTLLVQLPQESNHVIYMCTYMSSLQPPLMHKQMNGSILHNT